MINSCSLFDKELHIFALVRDVKICTTREAELIQKHHPKMLCFPRKPFSLSHNPALKASLAYLLLSIKPDSDE